MKPMSFYNVKTKKKQMLKTYKVVNKMVNGKKRRFAVGKCPKTGMEMWRVLPNK